MRFDKVDLNLLVALDALLDCCSVTEAARQLHITQSAMSNALRRLRVHFDDQLLVPLGRRMVSTERGQALRDPLREILLRIQQALTPVVDFDPTKSTRCFKLAVSDYFAFSYVPTLVEFCCLKGYSVTFDVQSLQPSITDGLNRGDIDLLIIPEIYCAEGHPSAPLFEDDWVCIASFEHPSTLTEEDFFAATHVIKGRVHDTYLPLDEWAVKRLGRQRHIVATVPQYSYLPRTIANTQHIATVPRRLATLHGMWTPLAVIDAPIAIPPLAEMMQWNAIHQNDSGLEWLRSTMSEVLSALTLTKQW